MSYGADVDEGENGSESAATVTIQGSEPAQRALPLAFVAGTTLARYVVLDEIGRGGMGHVFRAYDPTLQREVALKEVRRDALDQEATRRLVREARAMAKLSHPNVVAVYDVEELPSDEVVLVMEYVPGQSLRRWLRDDEHAWDEIVPRFIAAGRGLAAAHGAGLLHRDFKPANVLVDGDTVKVTDFGLAKLVGTAASSESIDVDFDDEASVLTDGEVVMGTPRYMAPEQHRALDLSPAADQFAFCVALWEALCGRAPYEGRTMVRDKLRGPPSWPARHVPGPIVDAIRRGLAPEPADRWPSMDALLTQLSWDPSQRRNRIVVAVGGIATLLVAGATYDSWAQTQAERCRGAAEQLGVWDDAERKAVEGALLGIDAPYARRISSRTIEALDDYRSGWLESHQRACEATQRGEQSPRMLEVRVACLRRAALEFRTAVDVLMDPDAEALRHAHTVTDELPTLVRCSDTEALASDVEAPSAHQEDAVEEVRAALGRAASLRRAGRHDDALAAVQSAERSAEGVDYGPLAGEVLAEEARALSSLGRYDDAEGAYQDALERAGRWQQWDLMRVVASELVVLVGVTQDRADDAARYLPIEGGLSENDRHAEARWRTNVGNIMLKQGRYAQAEHAFREAVNLRVDTVGPDHLSIAAARDLVGKALHGLGRLNEAEGEHRAALALRVKSVGKAHPLVARSRNILAGVLVDLDRLGDAESELRESLTAYGADDRLIAQTRHELARVLHRQERVSEALPLAELAWDRRDSHDVRPAARGDTASLLAILLWEAEGDAQDRGRAHGLAERAVQEFADAGPSHAADIERVRRWLDTHES